MTNSERLAGYVKAARENMRIGDELRDQWYAGPDTPTSLDPLVFLALLAEAWDEGYAASAEDEPGDSITTPNPYRQESK